MPRSNSHLLTWRAAALLLLAAGSGPGLWAGKAFQAPVLCSVTAHPVFGDPQSLFKRASDESWPVYGWLHIELATDTTRVHSMMDPQELITYPILDGVQGNLTEVDYPAYRGRGEQRLPKVNFGSLNLDAKGQAEVASRIAAVRSGLLDRYKVEDLVVIVRIAAAWHPQRANKLPDEVRVNAGEEGLTMGWGVLEPAEAFKLLDRWEKEGVSLAINEPLDPTQHRLAWAPLGLPVKDAADDGERKDTERKEP